MTNNFVSEANATDLMNAINQKKDTKPDTITWSEWIALSDSEREGTHYIITNVPAQFSINDAIFSIKNRTLVFTNKTCTINDDRITADTYVLTFYNDEAVAQAAGIDCTWTTGSITFTVVDNPVSDIVLDILFINPALSPGGGSSEQVQSDWNQTDTSEPDYIKNKPSNLAVIDDNNNFTASQTIDRKNGTVSDIGNSVLYLGNATPEGTAQNSRGILRLYGKGAYYANIYDANGLTDNRNISVPDKAGTLALTSDLDDKLDASRINFSAGTFNGDVLDAAKTMADGSIAFYRSSNNPANCPTDCKWGAYIFVKTGGNTMIIYMDDNHTATAYGISSTHTSITWHIS